MSPKGPTVLQILTHRAGGWKGGLLMTFIVVWWTEEELKGRPIHIEELVDSGYFSRRTVFRRQAEFREVFEPWGLKTPHDLAMLLPERTKSSLHTARLATA